MTREHEVTLDANERLEEAWKLVDCSDGPLDTRLAKFVEQARELAPQLMRAYDNFVDRLSRAEAGANAPGVGDAMPDFVLPDQNGRLFNLQEFLAEGPLIISFNRGHWCKFCRMELRSLAKAHDDLMHVGAQIVSIVPDTGEFAANLIESNALPFKILVDVDLGFVLSLGLAVFTGDEVKDLYKNKMGIDLARRHGNEAWLLPIPATLVVGTNGKIIAAHIDPDFRRRMTIEAIRSALRTS